MKKKQTNTNKVMRKAVSVFLAAALIIGMFALPAIADDSVQTPEVPVGTTVTLADGYYVPDEFTVVGGSGKVTITSPAFSVAGEKITSLICFSSTKYTNVKYKDVDYKPIKVGDEAYFAVPIALNEDNTITATTTSMGGKDIDYVIHSTVGSEPAAATLEEAVYGKGSAEDSNNIVASPLGMTRITDYGTSVEVKDDGTMDVTVRTKPLTRKYTALYLGTIAEAEADPDHVIASTLDSSVIGDSKGNFVEKYETEFKFNLPVSKIGEAQIISVKQITDFTTNEASWYNRSGSTTTFTVQPRTDLYNQLVEKAAAATDETVKAALEAAAEKMVVKAEDVTAAVSSFEAKNKFDIIPQKLTVASNTAESYGDPDNGDLSKVTFADLFYTLHKMKYGDDFTKETAKNYIVLSETGYLSKFMGVETYNISYLLNEDLSMAKGAYDTFLADNDQTTIFKYQDETNFSDLYTHFTEKEITAEVGKPVTLQLEALSWTVMPIGPVKKASTDNVTAAIVNEDGSLTAIEGAEMDDEGKISVTFNKRGTYLVSAMGNALAGYTNYSDYSIVTADCPIVAPAYCTIKVEKTYQDGFYSTEVSTDKASYGWKEAKDGSTQYGFSYPSKDYTFPLTVQIKNGKVADVAYTKDPNEIMANTSSDFNYLLWALDGHNVTDASYNYLNKEGGNYDVYHLDPHPVKNGTGLREQIIAKNGTDGVDTVTAATITSRAIIDGVNQCLAKAEKGEKDDPEPVLPTPDTSEDIIPADGEYTAEGTCVGADLGEGTIVLTVKDGKMTAKMGIEQRKSSYPHIYAGTEAEALAAGEDAWLIPEDYDYGYKNPGSMYTDVPIKSLDKPLHFVMFAKSSGNWFNRLITIDSKSLKETEASIQAKAQVVIDMIDALPETAGINDEAAVKAARDAYDALAEAPQALVTNIEKLEKAETQVAAAKDLSTATIAKIADQTYTGKELKPALTVKKDGKTLKAGTDYTVKYTNNKNVGTATATITGKGNYNKTNKVTFKIVKANSTITLKAKTATYNGKAVAVAKATVKGSTGKVTYTYYTNKACTKKIAAKNVKNAGTYYVKATVAANANYKAATSKAVVLKINKAAQPMKVQAVKKIVKFKALKKNAQTVTGGIKIAKKAQGTITYTKVAKGSAKNITINKKTGKITLKKGMKAVRYKLVVDVKTAGNKNYKAATRRVTVWIQVKK